MNKELLLHQKPDLEMTITDEILDHITHFMDVSMEILQDVIPVVVFRRLINSTIHFLWICGNKVTTYQQKPLSTLKTI